MCAVVAEHRGANNRLIARQLAEIEPSFTNIKGQKDTADFACVGIKLNCYVR